MIATPVMVGPNFGIHSLIALDAQNQSIIMW